MNLMSFIHEKTIHEWGVQCPMKSEALPKGSLGNRRVL